MPLDRTPYEAVISGQQKLAIFSAGRYAKVMYIVLQEEGIPVHYFYDNDVRREGMEVIGGLRCALPPHTNENIVCVVAVNDFYGDEIYKQALTLGFASVIRCYNSELDELVSQFDDETMIRLLYKGIYGREIDLQNPKTFNEKVNWLKLHDRRPIYTTVVDKYAVRQYVADTIGEEYLIPLVGGPWKSFDEINLDTLPRQFVLKGNHDSGSVLVCKNKDTFDFEAAQNKLTAKLKANFYCMMREWGYKNVTPQIIAEQYIEETPDRDLTEYKFFCFNGTPKMVWVECDRFNTPYIKKTLNDYFLIDGWKCLGFTKTNPVDITERVKAPENLDQMLGIASKLSKEFPQTRVDLYSIRGKIYFGEITPTHYGGFERFCPPEWEKRFGSWITLPTQQSH